MSSTTKQLPQISLSEAAEKFKAALQAAGLTPPDMIRARQAAPVSDQW